MSKTVIHPVLCVQSFQPLISLTQDQLSLLISTETNRQAYEQLKDKKSQFSIRTTVDFRISDDRVQGSILEIMESSGTHLVNMDKVSTAILTTVQHKDGSAHGPLVKEYRTTLDKDALSKLIKEVYTPPTGFRVDQVSLDASLRSSKGSVLQATLTLAMNT